MNCLLFQSEDSKHCPGTTRPWSALVSDRLGFFAWPLAVSQSTHWTALWLVLERDPQRVLSLFRSKLLSNLPCSPQLQLSPWSIRSGSINSEHPLVSPWASRPWDHSLETFSQRYALAISERISFGFLSVKVACLYCLMSNVLNTVIPYILMGFFFSSRFAKFFYDTSIVCRSLFWF